MQGDELQTAVFVAIGKYGVPKVARLLEVKPEAALRIAVPGARPHKGTVALAAANVHRLHEDARIMALSLAPETMA